MYTVCVGIEPAIYFYRTRGQRGTGLSLQAVHTLPVRVRSTLGLRLTLVMPMTDRVTVMIPCYHFNCNSWNMQKKIFCSF